MAKNWNNWRDWQPPLVFFQRVVIFCLIFGVIAVFLFWVSEDFDIKTEDLEKKDYIFEEENEKPQGEKQ